MTAESALRKLLQDSRLQEAIKDAAAAGNLRLAGTRAMDELDEETGERIY